MPPKCLQIRTHGVGVGAINLRGGEIKGEASSLKEGAVPRGQVGQRSEPLGTQYPRRTGALRQGTHI